MRLLLSLCILYSFAYHLVFPDFVQVCSLVVSISLVTTRVFKASVFPDELLHSAVCQLRVSPACVSVCFALSLSLCTLFLFVFDQLTRFADVVKYGLFSIYSNLFGHLYFGYDLSRLDT